MERAIWTPQVSDDLTWSWDAFIRRCDEKKIRPTGIWLRSEIRTFKSSVIRAAEFITFGYQADWEKVFATAAELDKAVEIDGYPERQDLNVELLRLARAAEVRISLGTDSHGPSQLRFMELAAGAALIGGIPKNRILNCMKKDELLGWVDNVRSRVHARHAKSK